MSDALPAGFIAIPPGPKAGAVTVGLSGGLDSCVLLHMLAAQAPVRDRGLRALHVHHGLQADADAWALHCHVFCDALGVPLQVVRVEVDRGGGCGLEAAARDARRRAFAETVGEDEVLALAHHRDDQAETFLMRALRASGPDGLAAMRPWRRFGNAWLWRPLLDLSRALLLEHARRHHLRWIEDPSNADVAPDRNFLRHHVLPALRERWPHVDAAFARSAALSADARDLLVDGDAAALARVRKIDPRILSVGALQALSHARRARVLRLWTGTLGLPPLPARGVAEIESDLLTAATDDHAAFRWRGAVVRRWRDLLHAGAAPEPLSPGWQTQWDGRAPLALPTGGQFCLEGSGGFERPVRVHARNGGERIVLPGRHHSHALKHVLQDLGVPPWLREQLPLLSDADGQLLAAGDLAFSAGFDAWLRTSNARLSWVPS